MTGALSTFAQKLNVNSPKSFHSRTSRKASLLVVASTGGIEPCPPGISVQTVDSPSELCSSEIPEGTFPSPPQQLVDRDGASPSIVYSSASYPSTTDLSTLSLSLLTNRTGSSLSGTSDGYLSSSPNTSTFVDNSPPSPSHTHDFAPEEVTALTQRRGVKRLLSLRSSNNSSVVDRSSPPRPKSPFTTLSPLSPRFAFNILRRPDLDPPDDKCLTGCHEDVDPFSRASPSVFYSDGGRPSHEPIVHSWLSRPEGSSASDDPEIQARSPLSDLSVYLCHPPQLHVDTPSKVKSRLHVWVSGIGPQLCTTGINPAAQTAAQPRVLPRCASRKNRKPNLRPLVLPNLVVLREIVNARQESIASPTFRPVMPQQDVLRRASHRNDHTASPESPSADTALGLVHGRPMASLPPPPELVTSTDMLPAALGSRRLSRESICEPVIVRGDDNDGNVAAAPQQSEGEAGALSQPQCHCSVPVPHESGQPSQDRYQEGPSRLGHEGKTQALQLRRNCDKPLPEEPQPASDKPLPRDPLDKPLPQVPLEARLDGLISLLHQAGVLADSAQSLRALALACGSGHAARSSVYPRMSLKGSVSMDLRRAVLESMNDRAGQDHFAARSPSLWSIATQWAYAL